MKICLTVVNSIVFLFLSVEANSETWRNVGECGKGLTCDPKCQLRCLEMHNYYRSLHNSPPLSCDQGLAESAQTWTDQQANDGAMYSSAWTDQYTESISWKGEGWAGMDQMEAAIAGAVRSWYSEIKNDYNYQTGKGNGKAVGHFQAAVWKSTTKLGCGINIKSGDGTYVTAHYAPASHANVNYFQLAPLNVQPRIAPVPACDVRSSARELCDDSLKAPYVTPVECVSKGCCYDDMFMSEPSVWFYDASGRKWCFKHKQQANGTDLSENGTDLSANGTDLSANGTDLSENDSE